MWHTIPICQSSLAHYFVINIKTTIPFFGFDKSSLKPCTPRRNTILSPRVNSTKITNPTAVVPWKAEILIFLTATNLLHPIGHGALSPLKSTYIFELPTWGNYHVPLLFTLRAKVRQRWDDGHTTATDHLIACSFATWRAVSKVQSVHNISARTSFLQPCTWFKNVHSVWIIWLYTGKLFDAGSGFWVSIEKERDTLAQRYEFRAKQYKMFCGYSRETMQFRAWTWVTIFLRLIHF